LKKDLEKSRNVIRNELLIEKKNEVINRFDNNIFTQMDSSKDKLF
jgi:hypothetical protein